MTFRRFRAAGQWADRPNRTGQEAQLRWSSYERGAPAHPGGRGRAARAAPGGGRNPRAGPRGSGGAGRPGSRDAVRRQSATVHELAQVELLAGLPGETLAALGERMERRQLDARRAGGRRGRGGRPVLRRDRGRAPGGAGRPRRARPPAPGRLLRRGRAPDGRSADGEHPARSAPQPSRAATARRSTSSSAPSSRAEFVQNCVRERGPALDRPVSEVAVGQHGERQAGLGIDPEERARAAEVAERPRRVPGARPMRRSSRRGARSRAPSRSGSWRP